MMPSPFHRRDSLRYAGGLAIILAALGAAAAGQWAGSGWGGVGLAALVAAGAAVLLAGLASRRLPPDLPFHRLDAAERLEAAGPAPPGSGRLRVAFAYEPLGVSRMDVYLDDVRVGQLCAGMAFVIPVRPGLRVLSARVWLRRVDLRDQVNALPGTDSDITIRVSGSKARSYGVERHSLRATLGDARTILVRPAVPQA